MALTAAYFVNELLIPGVSGTTYAEVENLATLTATIAKYEPKFLKLLLGEDLYAEYAAAIAGNPTSGIWFDLKSQIYSTSPAYESPVANYVYWKFWKSNATVTVKAGETETKSENAQMVSIAAKMVRAWNEMVDQVDEIREWLDDHSSDYPTWGTEDVETFTKIGLC